MTLIAALFCLVAFSWFYDFAISFAVSLFYVFIGYLFIVSLLNFAVFLFAKDTKAKYFSYSIFENDRRFLAWLKKI